MAANPYNGFTGEQRTKGGNWYNRAKKNGTVPQPEQCHACLRISPSVNGHSEDYSEPHGPHIGAHHLCYPCHMAVHCRFRNPAAWLKYRDNIREGAQHHDTRNFKDFIIRFNSRTYTPPIVNEPRTSTFLDTLPLTREQAEAAYHPDRKPTTLF